MRSNTWFTLALLILVMAAAGYRDRASAQTPKDTRLEGMKKLDFLAGNWKGMGWVEIIPGNVVRLSGTEMVRCQMGGRVLQIQGEHSNRPSESTDGGAGLKPIANQSVEIDDFVLISYDPKADGYRMRLYKPDGSFADGRAVLAAPNEVQWEYRQASHLNVRLTINVDQNGEWSQTREFTTDGKNWKTYFKMTLMRESEN